MPAVPESVLVSGEGGCFAGLKSCAMRDGRSGVSKFGGVNLETVVVCHLKEIAVFVSLRYLLLTLILTVWSADRLFCSKHPTRLLSDSTY